MTVQGILMALVPILLGVFQIMGIGVTETVVVDIIQQVTAVIAGVTMLYGMLRKAYNSLK